MRIGIPRELHSGETRVAATPETVKKLTGFGTVVVERGAGAAAHFSDEAYAAAGATLGSAAEALSSDIVLKVRAPGPDELPAMRAGAVLIGMLNPHDTAQVERLVAAGLAAFALESAPRISRAQSLDVLSSQANIAGYKAVMLAAQYYPRFMPMLMTAAGTVKAARVLVLGAGVAGLQAIATAKRLGAVTEAFDVRPDVKEQVESLGAKFVEVPLNAEERELAAGTGGYAREMGADYKARQAALITERAKQADIVITTALIPGRPAPVLIDAATVQSMKPGAVIVDLAVERGGNCPLSEPDQVVVKHGVTLVGYTNLPAMVPTDASSLYARNLLDFLKLIVDKSGVLQLDTDDEIVRACRLRMATDKPAANAAPASAPTTPTEVSQLDSSHT